MKATKQQLLNYVEELSGQDCAEYSYSELKDLAAYCGRQSIAWFGESLTFEEWAK